MTQNASTYYTTLSYGAYILIQSLYIPTGIIGIYGNTLVLVAYVKYREFRRIPCAHLIAALSVCDFICGCGTIAAGVARLKIPLFDDYSKFEQNILFVSYRMLLALYISNFYIQIICLLVSDLSFHTVPRGN